MSRVTSIKLFYIRKEDNVSVKDRNRFSVNFSSDWCQFGNMAKNLVDFSLVYIFSLREFTIEMRHFVKLTLSFTEKTITFNY